jgi:hypothetical protein
MRNVDMTVEKNRFINQHQINEKKHFQDINFMNQRKSNIKEIKNTEKRNFIEISQNPKEFIKGTETLEDTTDQNKAMDKKFHKEFLVQQDIVSHDMDRGIAQGERLFHYRNTHTK